MEVILPPFGIVMLNWSLYPWTKYFCIPKQYSDWRRHQKARLSVWYRVFAVLLNIHDWWCMSLVCVEFFPNSPSSPWGTPPICVIVNIYYNYMCMGYRVHVVLLRIHDWWCLCMGFRVHVVVLSVHDIVYICIELMFSFHCI